MRDSDPPRLLERMVREYVHDVGTTLSAAESRSLADEIESLETGMATRNEIGEAQGVIVERFGLTATAAFAMLARPSHHTRCRIVATARELAPTGEMRRIIPRTAGRAPPRSWE